MQPFGRFVLGNGVADIGNSFLRSERPYAYIVGGKRDSQAGLVVPDDEDLGVRPLLPEQFDKPVADDLD